jgi:hypothetical protein
MDSPTPVLKIKSQTGHLFMMNIYLLTESIPPLGHPEDFY